jgi:hypothetical protein
MISIHDIYNYLKPPPVPKNEDKEFCRACRKIKASFERHVPGKEPSCPFGVLDLLRVFPYFFLGPRKFVQGMIKEISQESAGKAKKALIIEANGGARDFPVLTDIPKIRRLAQTHSIEYYPISSQKDFFTMLKKLPEERLYDSVWIRGHGNTTGVYMGDLRFSPHMNRYGTFHFPYHIRVLSQKIREGGRVIFESCNVGTGKFNCAKSFSRLCPKVTVYASKTLHDAVSGLTMQKDGKPHFRGFFGITSTRIYQKGRKVSLPIDSDGAKRQSEGPLPEDRADASGSPPRTARDSLPPL